MSIESPLSVPIIPDAATIPLLLLVLSCLIRKHVHKEKWLASFHTVPPRLALAAMGILVAAATSPGSRLLVHAAGRIVPAAVSLLLLFVVGYFVCELWHASAKKGGAHALLSILGTGLSFGLVAYAAFYAMTAPELIARAGGAR